MNIVIMVIIILLIISFIAVFSNEMANLTLFGGPFKNHKRYSKLIEENLSKGLDHDDMVSFQDGYISTIPGGSIFGRYYYFNMSKKFFVVIPWWSPLHHDIKPRIKGR